MLGRRSWLSTLVVAFGLSLICLMLSWVVAPMIAANLSGMSNMPGARPTSAALFIDLILTSTFFFGGGFLAACFARGRAYPAAMFVGFAGWLIYFIENGALGGILRSPYPFWYNLFPSHLGPALLAAYMAKRQPSTFRIALWYLKLMLLELPLDFALRLVAVSTEVMKLFNPVLRDRLTPLGLTIDCASVVVGGIAAWAIWHPRPASRWVIAVALLFSVGYRLVGDLYLPHSSVNEASFAFQFGKLSVYMAIFGWAYLCVFGERALGFFRVSSAPEN